MRQHFATCLPKIRRGRRCWCRAEGCLTPTAFCAACESWAPTAFWDLLPLPSLNHKPKPTGVLKILPLQIFSLTRSQRAESLAVLPLPAAFPRRSLWWVHEVRGVLCWFFPAVARGWHLLLILSSCGSVLLSSLQCGEGWR